MTPDEFDKKLIELTKAWIECGKFYFAPFAIFLVILFFLGLSDAIWRAL
jgi:hypothetical protein